MLKIKNVSKSYDQKVLNNFSYEFPQHGLFVIRGNSGVGKTTLLRLIADLEKPDEGEIQLEKGSKISFVFQEARLFPFVTLLENILLVKKENDLKKAKRILEEIALLDAMEKYPHELSGGMKLRGAVARSLYYGGDIYLWDEPTKELDPKNRTKMIELIHAMAEDKLMIVVSHDPELCGGTEIYIQ